MGSLSAPEYTMLLSRSSLATFFSRPNFLAKVAAFMSPCMLERGSAAAQASLPSCASTSSSDKTCFSMKKILCLTPVSLPCSSSSSLSSPRPLSAAPLLPRPARLPGLGEARALERGETLREEARLGAGLLSPDTAPSSALEFSRLRLIFHFSNHRNHQ